MPCVCSSAITGSYSVKKKKVYCYLARRMQFVSSIMEEPILVFVCLDTALVVQGTLGVSYTLHTRSALHSILHKQARPGRAWK